MLVFDGSAAAEYLLQRPLAPQIEAHLSAVDFDVHAPELFDYEVMSVLRRFVAAGHITGARANAAAVDLRDLQVFRHPLAPLVPRVWQLRDNFSPYDAAYVAVAEGVAAVDPAPVLTADMKLARAIQDHAAVPVIALR